MTKAEERLIEVALEFGNNSRLPLLLLAAIDDVYDERMAEARAHPYGRIMEEQMVRRPVPYGRDVCDPPARD